MKKSLIILGIITLGMLITFSSCKKETTVSVKNECNFELYGVFIMGYTDAGDKISQLNMADELKSNTKTSTQMIDNRCSKAKIGLRLQKSGKLYYTVQYFMLDIGKDNVITINGKTLISTDLDKSKSETDLGVSITEVVVEKQTDEN